MQVVTKVNISPPRANLRVLLVIQEAFLLLYMHNLVHPVQAVFSPLLMDLHPVNDVLLDHIKTRGVPLFVSCVILELSEMHLPYHPALPVNWENLIIKPIKQFAMIVSLDPMLRLKDY